MHNQQDDAKKTSINTEGGTFINGDVNTGGGTFVGRDQNIAGDYNVQIYMPAVQEDPQKAQEKYKDSPLLRIIYEEEECAQASQVGLHHLADFTGLDLVLLEANLEELEKVGLVKHIVIHENQRTFDFYSITRDGKVLVINSRSQQSR